MCFLLGRQKHNFFPIFGLAPNTWSCSDVMFLLKFLVFQAFGTFNYLCVFSTSLAVQRRTPLGFRQKHSRILLYMHWFRIVSSVNSWVARLLRLPPMFCFVRLGVQRENHCDCSSSSHGQAPQWRKPKNLFKRLMSELDQVFGANLKIGL